MPRLRQAEAMASRGSSMGAFGGMTARIERRHAASASARILQEQHWHERCDGEHHSACRKLWQTMAAHGTGCGCASSKRCGGTARRQRAGTRAPAARIGQGRQDACMGRACRQRLDSVVRRRAATLQESSCSRMRPPAVIVCSQARSDDLLLRLLIAGLAMTLHPQTLTVFFPNVQQAARAQHAGTSFNDHIPATVLFRTFPTTD